jgi:hypothetical protein
MILFISFAPSLLCVLAAFALYRSGESRDRTLAAAVAALGVGLLLLFQHDAAYFLYENKPALIALGLGSLLLAYGAYHAAAGQARPRSNLGVRRSASNATTDDVDLGSLAVPRNSTNSFTRAEGLRDSLYDRIQADCDRQNVQVVGYKSYPQSGSVWLRFDYLLAAGSEHLRLPASLKISIERFDYHRFEHLLSVEIVHGGKVGRVTNLLPLLSDADIWRLNELVCTGKRIAPSDYARARSGQFQFWLPRNNVATLRPDWVFLGLVAALGVGFLLFGPVLPLGLLLMVGSGVALFLHIRQRKTYLLTTGKPLDDPRKLIRLDYWQATLDKLGSRAPDVRRDLLERLGSASEKSIVTSSERIWYPGVDGKVEREQLVCRFRRAIGFVHLESYGDDLYIGWDTHVNSGTWVEQTLQHGVDRRSGKYVVAKRVVEGWQLPNEYDVDDVNFLTEWLHAGIVRVVRLKMEELKIDQEIDFTIQRESRTAALSGSASEDRDAGRSSGIQGVASRLRRVG